MPLHKVLPEKNTPSYIYRFSRACSYHRLMKVLCHFFQYKSALTSMVFSRS